MGKGKGKSKPNGGAPRRRLLGGKKRTQLKKQSSMRSVPVPPAATVPAATVPAATVPAVATTTRGTQTDEPFKRTNYKEWMHKTFPRYERHPDDGNVIFELGVKVCYYEVSMTMSIGRDGTYELMPSDPYDHSYGFKQEAYEAIDAWLWAELSALKRSNFQNVGSYHYECTTYLHPPQDVACKMKWY